MGAIWQLYSARPGPVQRKPHDEDPYYYYCTLANFFESQHVLDVLHMLDILPLQAVAKAFASACKHGSKASVFKACKGLRACCKEGKQLTSTIVTELFVQLEKGSASALHKQASLVKDLPYLQDLTIHQPEQEQVLEFLGALQDAKQPNKVSRLRIQDCNHLDVRFFEQLAETFPGVEFLILDACYITCAEGEQLFASLSACSKLHTLVVAAVGLPSSTLKSLEGVSSLRTLVLAQPESEWAETQHRKHGVQAFTVNTADLSGLTQLESLDIHCNLSPASCAPLSALTNMKSLGMQLMGEGGGICWQSDVPAHDMGTMLQSMRKLEAFHCDVHLADEARDALTGNKNLKVIDVMSMDTRGLAKGAFPAIQQMSIFNWPMHTRTVVNLLQACPSLASLHLKPSPWADRNLSPVLELTGYIANLDDASEISEDLAFLEAKLPALGLEVGLLQLQTWSPDVLAAQVVQRLPVTNLPKAVQVDGINGWDTPTVQQLARCFSSLEGLCFKHASGFSAESVLALTAFSNLAEVYLPISCLAPSQCLPLVLSALILMHPTLDTIEYTHGVAYVSSQGGDSEAKLCVQKAVTRRLAAPTVLHGDGALTETNTEYCNGLSMVPEHQGAARSTEGTAGTSSSKSAEMHNAVAQSNAAHSQEAAKNISRTTYQNPESPDNNILVLEHMHTMSNGQASNQAGTGQAGNPDEAAPSAGGIRHTSSSAADHAPQPISGQDRCKRRGTGRGRYRGKQSRANAGTGTWAIPESAAQGPDDQAPLQPHGSYTHGNSRSRGAYAGMNYKSRGNNSQASVPAHNHKPSGTSMIGRLPTTAARQPVSAHAPHYVGRTTAGGQQRSARTPQPHASRNKQPPMRQWVPKNTRAAASKPEDCLGATSHSQPDAPRPATSSKQQPALLGQPAMVTMGAATAQHSVPLTLDIQAAGNDRQQGDDAGTVQGGRSKHRRRNNRRTSKLHTQL